MPSRAIVSFTPNNIHVYIYVYMYVYVYVYTCIYVYIDLSLCLCASLPQGPSDRGSSTGRQGADVELHAARGCHKKARHTPSQMWSYNYNFWDMGVTLQVQPYTKVGIWA